MRATRSLPTSRTVLHIALSAFTLAACEKQGAPGARADAGGPSVPGDPVAEPRTTFSAAAYRARVMPLAARDETDGKICHPALDGDGVVRRRWCYDDGEFSSEPADDRALPDDLSILAWSCVEPYSYEPDAERPSIALRYALSMHRLALRAEGMLRIEGFPESPSLGIGLGDQIYVDPRPSQIGAGGATLAAFGGEDSAERRIDKGDEDAFYRAAYEAYFFNEPMARALASLPTLMTWDDHEIRDGWGSQGDEREPKWRSWFDAAGRSFAAWQLKRGPLGADASWRDPSKREGPCVGYPQYVERGDVSIYITDQRTCRTPKIILGRGQRNDLAERMSRKRLACGARRVWVIGSATPLFITKSNPAPDAAAQVDGELHDDVRDRWSDDVHAEEQREVIGTLIGRMDACPEEKLIVLSGDIHRSGLIAISRQRGDRTITVGYEVISSGIAADVDGHHTVSNLGTKAYDQGGVRGAWVGLMDSTPSFAELRIPPSGEPEVAWHVSNGINPDDLVVNDAHLTPMICADDDEAEPVTFVAERERSTTNLESGGRSDRVLVDVLRFGEERGEKSAMRLETALHPASIFSRNQNGATGDMQLRDLSRETLCAALKGPIAPRVGAPPE